MARDPIVLVRAFLAEHNPPLRLWLAPDASCLLTDTARSDLPAGTELHHVPAEHDLRGPAILVATADDLSGPHREELLALRTEALPGRTVICGGTSNKNVLLVAINSWQVFHLLPSRPSPGELTDAVMRAHRACGLEHAATRCAQQLRERCDELEAVLLELEATRELLLQAERLTTVSGFSRALSARLREHLERLRALEGALCGLPDDPRRAELLDFTMQSIHAIEALLADLLAKAEADENAPHDLPPPEGATR